MLRCVLVRRRIATERDAARLTGSQVHPLRADLHALFTLVSLRRFDGADSLNMSAHEISMARDT